NAGRRKAAERDDRENPLRRSGERPETARCRLVERLERSAAPRTVIDAAATEELGQTLAIETARPCHMPGRVVLLWPLPLQDRLRSAVPALLLPVRAHRAPGVVPDHGPCAESQRPFALLQPPAHVDVVAGHAKLRIEPANRLEGLLAERHVAARDVFSFTIAQQDMNRAAWGARDALRRTAVTGGRDVRSAHADIRGAQKSVRKIRQPLRIGVRVIVDVRDDLAAGCTETGVPRTRETTVLGLDKPAVVSARDGGGRVRRAVIHNDDLVVGVGQPVQRLEAIADRPGTVVRADDHGDPGPPDVWREGCLPESASGGCERGLRRAVGARQAEGPVVDVAGASVPLVGPRENESASAA